MPAAGATTDVYDFFLSSRGSVLTKKKEQGKGEAGGGKGGRGKP